MQRFVKVFGMVLELISDPALLDEIVDAIIDKLEDMAARTDNPIDDMLVAKVRDLSGVPDNDEEPE